MKRLIPKPILRAYHFCLAYLGAVIYRFPSRELIVIGITGTKGKSTTTEMVRAILAEAGHTVAVVSTIRFAIGETSERNLYKMTMPGRFFLQRFLRRAVTEGATHAVIEMTSEGARQYRHKGIDINALVFTNLAPEHLESHGGMEAYALAKLSLAEALAHSTKRPRIIVANADDPYGERFLAVDADIKAPFSLADAEPYTADDHSARFVWQGQLFTMPLPGIFNLKNALAAVTLGQALGISVAHMQKALRNIPPVSGRAERVEKGQQFAVVVDYAHTPDSLRALYETYSSNRIIGVLGSTGGGRDTWKRPEMGKIADEFCDVAILTNEDPYDEDPQAIVMDLDRGFTKHKAHIILDRREAIAAALAEARDGDVVLITGKGTDPYIMGPRGSKQVWSDKVVAEEELAQLGFK
ncbi:MAG: UDP-N-acetylmuramyl-tripeptide synthetase [Candidatus Adlerbacteria bacterium]|nr:UDP-N-acetylmuramyl-tripeptide synthetase [Candidatus Adlerbacteria bacterium]